MTQAPRKVLYIVTKSNWGGAQRYVCDLATGLPAGVFEPVVAFGPGEDGTPGVLGRRLSEAGIRTILVPELARDIGTSDLHAFFALWRLFRTERPSEVHLNSSKAAGLGALAARLSGVPHIVFTAHGWPFWEKRSLLARVLIYLASYATALLAHDTIVLSERDRRVMRLVPFSSRKLHVIPNGIDAPAFAPRARARAALLPGHVDDTRLWVGSIGELTANKDYDTALAAVEHAVQGGADIRYLIIGDGEERERLVRLIAERDLAAHVHLLGFIPDAYTLLKAFDIFLLPSRKEGLPYVLLEAGLAGIPVIASDVGAIPDVIEHGTEGVLVAAGDARAFGDALVMLAGDSTRRGAFGAALAQKVRAAHDVSSMRLATYKLY